MNCKVSHWFVIWNRHLATENKTEPSFLNYQQNIFQGHHPKLECACTSIGWDIEHPFFGKKSTTKPGPTSAQQFLVEQVLQEKSLEQAERWRGMDVVISRTQRPVWKDANEKWDWGEKTGRKERLQSQEPCKIVTRNQRQGWARWCLFQVSDCLLQRKGPQWLVSQVSYSSCDAVGENPTGKSRVSW